MPFPPIFPPPCGAVETECGRKPPPPRPGPPPIPPMCFSRETIIVYSLVYSSWPPKSLIWSKLWSCHFIETSK